DAARQEEPGRRGAAGASGRGGPDARRGRAVDRAGDRRSAGRSGGGPDLIPHLPASFPPRFPISTSRNQQFDNKLPVAFQVVGGVGGKPEVDKRRNGMGTNDL